MNEEKRQKITIQNDKVEKLAKQAGLAKHGLGWTAWESQLEKFARLVFEDALAWRDSQAGEPVAYTNEFQLEYVKNQSIKQGLMWSTPGEESIPVYTTPPAAQTNQQLFEALEKLHAVVIEKNRAGTDWGDLMGQLLAALSLAQSTLQAAKEQAK